MSPLPVSYAPLDAGATTTSSPPEAAEVVSVSTIAATAVATGHLLFKLEGYSRLKARHGESGSYIESSASKVGGHTWRIRCYLNGDTKEGAGFVSLFLMHCGTGPVLAEYELDLLPHHDHGTSPEKENGHQDDTPGKTKTKTKTSTKGLRTFGNKGSKDNSGCAPGWGVRRFIGVEKLEHSMFLKDDCLAVACTVTVVGERTVKEKAVQAGDLARLGMLCKCDDDLCKRHHDRPAAPSADTLLERFAKFCNSICHGHPGR